MKNFLRRTWRIILAACLLAALWLGRGWLLPLLPLWLDVGQRPQPADSIVLLTGDAQTRALAAAALWKAGWAERIIVTKVAGSDGAEKTHVPREDEINVQALRACGVPGGAIVLLEGPARNTYDEAEATAAYLARSGPQRLLVVTNGYHTRRARWTFERVIGARAQGIVLIGAPSDDVQPQTWWQGEEGFATIAGEYLKLGFYGFYYGYLGYLAGVVALLWLGWRVYRRKHLLAKDLGAGL